MFHFKGNIDGMSIQAVAAGNERNREVQTRWMTWANGIATIYNTRNGEADHGTHEQAFRDSLDAVGWSQQLALIHVISHEAQFAGPTETTLDIPEKLEATTAGLNAALRKFRSANANS